MQPPTNRKNLVFEITFIGYTSFSLVTQSQIPFVALVYYSFFFGTMGFIGILEYFQIFFRIFRSGFSIWFFELIFLNWFSPVFTRTILLFYSPNKSFSWEMRRMEIFLHEKHWFVWKNVLFSICGIKIFLWFKIFRRLEMWERRIDAEKEGSEERRKGLPGIAGGAEW